MADEAWREAERRLAAIPDDPELVTAAIVARRRSGQPVPGQLLERERAPARTFDSTLELTVHAALPDGTVRQVGTTPSKRPLRIPEQQAWWLAAEGRSRLDQLVSVALEARASGFSCASGPPDPITDDHLAALFDRVADVRVLGLPGSRLSSRSIERVARIGPLQRLDLSCGEGPPGEPRDLTPLGELRELLVLDLTGVSMRKTDLERLPASLRRLNLRGAGSIQAERLARFAELTHLDLRGVSGRATAMRGLASLQHLQSLGLQGTRVDDAALESFLPSMPALVLLDLERCDGITDRGLRCIADHARMLRSLNLDYARSTTPEGLLVLRDLSRLETLYLRGGKGLVAAQAPSRRALREALPACKVLPDS